MTYYQINYVSALSRVNEVIINIIRLLDLVISRKSRSILRTSTEEQTIMRKLEIYPTNELFQSSTRLWILVLVVLSCQ